MDERFSLSVRGINIWRSNPLNLLSALSDMLVYETQQQM